MIDGISGRPAGLGSGSPVRLDTSGPQTAAPAKPVTVGDVVETAPRAELSALATAARDASSAPIDKARVAQLREAIADGSYAVDPEKIAAKMIDLDLGWAGKGDGA